MHHVLRGCRFSREAWFLFATDLSPDGLVFVLNCSWPEFFEFWLPTNLLVQALDLGWSLWNNRNNCFFDATCKLPKALCVFVFSLADSYRKAQVPLQHVVD